MILTIDIGNTVITVGTVSKTGTHFVEHISTDVKKTDLEYAIAFRTILELYEIPSHPLTGSIISSVVPPLTAVVNRALTKIIGKPALVVGPGVKTGLPIKIDNPAQLGSDMVVNAVAAVAEYPLPLLLIDMGTATTLSVIDESGAYLGGSILPGAGIALDSLVKRTAQLPRISFDAPEKAIAKNTVDSMKCGIVYGSSAMLDGMIDRMEQELGKSLFALATGDLAKAVIPYCTHKIQYDEMLPLKGLYRIYMKNRTDGSC
ncbi:type III pantothenate kinase [Hominifimenecus sp. rT4P-3]|uniref:type III pantothenate kinase n=1 Tax=Hominifimenecus sp. rT4P-3 TaxID=3242979 RepID=UPI003DA40023